MFEDRSKLQNQLHNAQAKIDDNESQIEQLQLQLKSQKKKNKEMRAALTKAQQRKYEIERLRDLRDQHRLREDQLMKRVISLTQTVQIKKKEIQDLLAQIKNQSRSDLFEDSESKDARSIFNRIDDLEQKILLTVILQRSISHEDDHRNSTILNLFDSFNYYEENSHMREDKNKYSDVKDFFEKHEE